METTIHSIKKIVIGKIRPLGEGSTSYVRDIIIMSDKENLSVTCFGDCGKDLEIEYGSKVKNIINKIVK